MFFYPQHRLGASVLMLIILPLAFSCESGDDKMQITESYRSIIRIQLKHVEAIIDQLNSNCTIKYGSMWKEPKNAQQSIHRKICRVNGKLRRIGRGSENVNGELKHAIHKLGDEINASLRCWCHQKREGTKRRKLKICKVKSILANLQRLFEQYNVYQSFSTDLTERGKTSEQTGI